MLMRIVDNITIVHLALPNINVNMSVGNQIKKSSDDSVDPTILSTTVMPLEISSTPNSDEGSSTSKPLDVRQSNPSNLNTQGFINREKPGSLDMDEGKRNNQNISQEIEKDFARSNDILTKKGNLTQNGACDES